MIRETNIDLDIWQIDKAKVNKWEGYRKEEVKSLQYENGIKNGFVEDTGKLHIEPIFQVMVHLTKRNPEPLKPVIQPVQITVSRGITTNAENKKSRKALIFSDPHFGFSRNFRNGKLTPFHDRQALSIILQVVDLLKVDEVHLLGDVLDLPDFSDKFLRSPELRWTTQPAIIEAGWFIGMLANMTSVTLLEGNHDYRLYSSLIKNFEQAYDLRPADRLAEPPPISVPGLLGLDRIGVSYVDGYPDGYVRLGNSMRLIHGATVRNKSGGTVSAVIEDANTSVGFGHIHRLEMASKTLWDRKVVHAFSPGCTCKIDGSVPGSSKTSNWQQGFALINYDSEQSFVQLYPIENGVALLNDKKIMGYDYSDRLRRDVKEKDYDLSYQ